MTCVVPPLCGPFGVSSATSPVGPMGFVELVPMWVGGRFMAVEKYSGSDDIVGVDSPSCLFVYLEVWPFFRIRGGPPWGRSSRQRLLARLVGLDSIVATAFGKSDGNAGTEDQKGPSSNAPSALICA